MRFIDYNGSGGLDSHDVLTSVAVEEATRDDKPAKKNEQQLSNNAGCATMVTLAALPVLVILLAL